MLVLTRNEGEWITVGDYMYIQVDRMQLSGKREGKLKLKVQEDHGGRVLEYNKYISEEVTFINTGIEMIYGGRRGSGKHKIVIRADKELYVGRLDEFGGLVEEEEEDELLDMYKEELGWFF